MNSEERNKKYYQETFHEVHAPMSLTGKVMNMKKNENGKKDYSVVKRFAMTAAALAALFVGSNGVVYAATGSTWIENMIVYFNEAAYEVDVEQTVDVDGNVHYSGTAQLEDGPVAFFLTNESNDDVVDEMHVDFVDPINAPEIIEAGEVIYFTYGDLAIDITEDVADGEATGSFEKDGTTYQYTVRGNSGEWDVQIGY
ncbi:MAG: hypothetical protein E7290_08850 [Lachnospiraceae bacterium]|nr:hypothetical protein [Lachnospiraceae bacterium]